MPSPQSLCIRAVSPTGQPHADYSATAQSAFMEWVGAGCLQGSERPVNGLSGREPCAEQSPSSFPRSDEGVPVCAGCVLREKCTEELAGGGNSGSSGGRGDSRSQLGCFPVKAAQ